VLYSFKGISGDGKWPNAGLINVKGTLYGTTYVGGANGEGTVSATDPLIYREARKVHDRLRARIRSAGISVIAREAKVSRSVVKAFVNQGTGPHAPTIAKIEAALQRLSA
jgi:uncharacterized repeat protein (TIGR03803 family)